ncbi:GNAT family N-acetyltransferase [Polycladidibacter stylochi]|uniref:GNAT family N-acetyltransferase n=1 Tax=Polycladidibacter stylochi TaxID=1807766 RepID=UPI00082C133B|nr:GNAT family N-acetyltransferase [Pseudovibrio stylochi]
MAVTLREIESSDHRAVTDLLVRRWTSPQILIEDEMVDASTLPGYLAFDGNDVVGMVTVIKRDNEWEILTLDSLQRWGGIGSKLLDRVSDSALKRGIKRLMVRTSNDNLDAFRFYQRRGFRLEKVVQGVIDRERLLKPEIPATGLHGIPIHDEIIFAKAL